MINTFLPSARVVGFALIPAIVLPAVSKRYNIIPLFPKEGLYLPGMRSIVSFITTYAWFQFNSCHQTTLVCMTPALCLVGKVIADCIISSVKAAPANPGQPLER